MTSIAAEEHLSDDTVLDVSSGENAKRDDAVGVQGVTDLAETVDDRFVSLFNSAHCLLY